MKHPYEALPDKAYWRRAVAMPPAREVDPASTPRFKIDKASKVATAGSCFAQHIARHLVANGLTYLVTETAHPVIPPHLVDAYNYGVYTARYGNLYTARQFLQLLRRAYHLPGSRGMVWRQEERFIDPFRPQIQPNGFSSLAELEADREQHLGAVRRAVETLDVMVFTLGLTECWMDKETGIAFPLCPGVVGGEFDEKKHGFHNFSVGEVASDMLDAIDFIRARNAKAKFVLTVSPVPLIATARARHVLQATTYSKAVLRVAAEEISARRDQVEYFPSYEIITGSYNRGAYFAPDLRSVTEEGVRHVMRMFLRHFCDIESGGGTPAKAEAGVVDETVLASGAEIARVICEEEALNR